MERREVVTCMSMLPTKLGNSQRIALPMATTELVWNIYEESKSVDGVKEWALFLVKTERRLNSAAVPFKRGYWFFGKEGGDPARHRIYEQRMKDASAEVERLNRLLASRGADGERQLAFGTKKKKAIDATR